MINRNISQLIITFAFIYSSIICHFEAMSRYQNGEMVVAYILWICALSSFLGALRFRIAKIINSFKKKNYNE
tara:strand:+ start:321 stop:536 length:216 start_codon:yes stop_codon:yes gene_type:complete